MKKRALLLFGIGIIICGLITTTAYAEGGIEMPPINIPDESVSVNKDELSSVSDEYEASGVDFTEIPEVITPAPKTVKKPKATSIKKLTGAKKAFKIKWKKVKGVKGYQIQYSTKKKFKKKYTKTKTVKKAKTVKARIKKLKAGKKYYVRVRTYKVVNGKKVFSKWSKVKTVKTK